MRIGGGLCTKYLVDTARQCMKFLGFQVWGYEVFHVWETKKSESSQRGCKMFFLIEKFCSTSFVHRVLFNESYSIEFVRILIPNLFDILTISLLLIPYSHVYILTYTLIPYFDTLPSSSVPSIPKFHRIFSRRLFDAILSVFTTFVSDFTVTRKKPPTMVTIAKWNAAAW